MATAEMSNFKYPTKVFEVCADSPHSIIVHSGGTSSGKTYSIIQYLFTVAAYVPNQVITVAGQDIPNLKKGAYRDAQTIFYSDPFLISQSSFHNKSNREFQFKNGSVIEFNSYADFQDAKSGKRQFLFVNEANGVSYEIFEELQVRTTKKTFIDFNPTARFWAHDKLEHREDVEWFNSTFLDNPFIKDSIQKKIEGYEPTPENIARGTANEYRWQVYGLGEVGRLEGLVFPDFKVTQSFPNDYKWRAWGMDFGYTNDPTTLIEIRLHGGDLYVKEHIYETGLTNPDISLKLTDIGFPKDEKIIADSAEPKSIEELKRKGWRIEGAEKGKDSINQGIDAIKRYNVYIEASSKNLIEEFSSYTWDKDRNGNPTNKPIDTHNHLIDAFRYALTNKILKRAKTLSWS
jgi:phage terminase large subunit